MPDFGEGIHEAGQFRNYLGDLTDEALDRFVERFPIRQLGQPGGPNSYNDSS